MKDIGNENEWVDPKNPGGFGLLWLMFAVSGVSLVIIMYLFI